MKKELKESFKCDIDFFDTLMTKNQYQNERYRKRLIDNDYTIVEARSNHKNMITYAPTRALFEKIIQKYNIDNIFESLECFSELAKLNECSMGACGEEFSIWCSKRDFPYHFSYRINFKTHKTTYDFTKKGGK